MLVRMVDILGNGENAGAGTNFGIICAVGVVGTLLLSNVSDTFQYSLTLHQKIYLFLHLNRNNYLVYSHLPLRRNTLVFVLF